MRVPFMLAVLAVPAIGHADVIVDAVGGLTFPIADDNWTNRAETSPKLEVRAGALRGDFGAMFQSDWTPLELDNTGASFPGGSLNTAGHVFRFLADGVFQHAIAPRLAITARAGVGVDIAYGSYAILIGNTSTGHSNTDAGIAFELGGGLWFNVRPDIQLGGELALPISYHHAPAAKIGDISFDYTSCNIDLLFGVRLFSR